MVWGVGALLIPYHLTVSVDSICAMSPESVCVLSACLRYTTYNPLSLVSVFVRCAADNRFVLHNYSTRCVFFFCCISCSKRARRLTSASCNSPCEHKGVSCRQTTTNLWSGDIRTKTSTQCPLMRCVTAGKHDESFLPILERKQSSLCWLVS